MGQNHYDYIIAGAGAAGLSLLYHLLQQNPGFNKRVLLIDKNLEKQNDRTWCFWEAGSGPFEAVVSRKWNTLHYHSQRRSKLLHIAPYEYKMVQGIDFYKHCFAKIKANPHVTLLQASIEGMESTTTAQGTHVGTVNTSQGTYTAQYVFNSARVNTPKHPHNHYLLQHFKGWYIKLNQGTWPSMVPNFMDFRVNQYQDCRFVYVFPQTENTGLVEYTVFSQNMLTQEQYTQGIEQYLQQVLPVGGYTVEHEEFGVIPMTNARFKPQNGPAIINIGTAGGHTKASTGYTFTFIQRQTQRMAANLQKGLPPNHGMPKSQSRFALYDAIFLGVLSNPHYPSYRIFDDMFAKLPPALVLDFLNEESTFWQELRVMTSVNMGVFAKSLLKEVGKALQRAVQPQGPKPKAGQQPKAQPVL